MMHSVHHIYGASEKRLDELAHRIRFAFAKRIFAVGEISRNDAYYTYFIFSTACIIYTEAKHPETMHTIHICFFKLPRYFITFALSCQGFLKRNFIFAQSWCFYIKSPVLSECYRFHTSFLRYGTFIFSL